MSFFYQCLGISFYYQAIYCLILQKKKKKKKKKVKIDNKKNKKN